MGKDLQNKGKKTQLMRRGHEVYKVNPSLSDPLPVRIRPGKFTKETDAYMVAPGTGEIVTRGAFGFVEEKEIDSEEFVKVYLDGIRKYGELSKPGAQLFEFVYREISGKDAKDRDMVTLNYMLALDWKPDLPRTTYYRGLNELLEKGFLFRSVAADVYFVNVRFMFNGNRMVLVQSYRRKVSQASTQGELPLDNNMPLLGE